MLWLQVESLSESKRIFLDVETGLVWVFPQFTGLISSIWKYTTGCVLPGLFPVRGEAPQALYKLFVLVTAVMRAESVPGTVAALSLRLMLCESKQSSGPPAVAGGFSGVWGVKVVTFKKNIYRGRAAVLSTMEQLTYWVQRATSTVYFQRKAPHSVTHKSEEAPFDFKFKVYTSNFVCFLC